MDNQLAVAEFAPGGRIFRGWFVVAGAFAITFLGFGSAYTFSVFLTPLQREFGAARGAVSLVFALAGFLYFGLGVISGPLADRLGARRLAALGMLLVGGGLVVAGLAQTLEQVYLGYGLGVGLGVGCSYAPAVGAVQHWFSRRRGFASGLAVSGIGMGTLVMPPAAAWLIAAIGWRETYLVLGAATALAGCAVALLLDNDPAAHGLAPDGDPPGATLSRSAATGSTLRDAVRSRQFIGLYAGCVVCSFGLFVPFVHLVPYATDHGVDKAWAVLLLGAIGVGSTAGRFTLGALADKVGRLASFVASFIGMAAACAVWAVSGGLAGLTVFALLYGLAYGGFVALAPALLMDLFGARAISGIIGVLYTSVAFGTLVGPSAAGFAYDATHSYTIAILGSVAANLVAAAIVLAACRKQR